MSMKFNKPSQLLLVSAASLLAASLVTACGTLTVDFVFVTSSKAAGPYNYGEINVMEVDSESGHLRQIPTSPFPSGGRNPVAEAISTDQSTLYVVNHDDNDIVQFAIGNDGKVYPQNTVNTPAVFPIAAVVSGSNLFVLDTYQPLSTCSTANPCSGAVGVLPIASDDSLGTPLANGNLQYWPLSLPGSSDVLIPTAINVVVDTVPPSGTSTTPTVNTYVYVSAVDWTASGGANPAETLSICNQPTTSLSSAVGYVFSFQVVPQTNPPASNPNATTLVPLPNSVPVAAGILPCALASDTIDGAKGVTTGSYLYAADTLNGNVLGYSVAPATGLLTQLSGSPFAAGNQPSAITVDPTGNYAFVTNAVDSTISAYTISNGVLKSFGTYPTSTQPVAVLVDPSTNHYVYAANYLGGTVSGFMLDSNSSPVSLLATPNTPYRVNAQPTAMVAITHGGAPAKQ